MARALKRQSCKHEALSLVPRIHRKIAGVVAGACNPVLGRQEQEDT